MDIDKKLSDALDEKKEREKKGTVSPILPPSDVDKALAIPIPQSEPPPESVERAETP